MSLNPFGLILVAVVGYVAYRVIQARRRGDSGARAASRAIAEAAPPAIAAGLGLVLLYLALVVVMMMFVTAMMVAVFTVPFAVVEAIFTGGEPTYSLGPFHELAGQAYAFMFMAMLMFLAAMVWITVVAVRRARAMPAAVEVAPAEAPSDPPAATSPGSPRRRPLRAAGR